MPARPTSTPAGPASASIGWGFGNGVRAEIEGNYRPNEIDRSGQLRGCRAQRHFQYTYGVMANALYDFDLANFGIGRVPSCPMSVSALAMPGPVAQHPCQSNRAGPWAADQRRRLRCASPTRASSASPPLTWLGATGLTLTAEYRFFGTLHPTSTPDRAAVPSRSWPAARTSRRTTTTRSCSACATPSTRRRRRRRCRRAPAAAPAPARTYLVFFDWDRADLTARARQIIDEAAPTPAGCR